MTQVEITKDDLTAFNADLGELQKKHNLKIGAEPYIEEGKIVARAVVTPIIGAKPAKDGDTQDEKED